MKETHCVERFNSQKLTGLIEPLAAMIASAENPTLMRALVIDEIRDQVVAINRDATQFVKKWKITTNHL